MSLKFALSVTAVSIAFTGSCSRVDEANAHANTSAPHQCAAEQIKHNEMTVRLVFDEILTGGKIAENEHIYHTDFVVHGDGRDGGRQEDRAATEEWRKMAPDIRMTPLRVVADCDMAAVHWQGTGTNTGGGNGIPATGSSIRVQGVTFFKFRGGKIAEEWTVFDQYAFLKQLGLLK